MISCRNRISPDDASNGIETGQNEEIQEEMTKDIQTVAGPSLSNRVVPVEDASPDQTRPSESRASIPEQTALLPPEILLEIIQLVSA